MQNVIDRLAVKRADLLAKKDDEGFTLIELLVVVVIIGVLVAIAVPVYLNYRQGAADKSAQSDVRGAISAVEQFYTSNNNTYPASASADGTVASLALPGISGGTAGTITLSDKTKLTYINNADGTYKLCASNGGGSGKTYRYLSASGGSVQAVSGISLTTCA
ncbi:prepilin-type N-terminal cleavage/methylation domain-containing protein [Actinoplanes sp. L3-i22]|uniref:prepilin-type N-terminal cleavage/methylation domain-containing protein n=1 Tax=Actinoplanes sp. L3-i22 TaxID=2836373 RepID=UPI001C771EA9|nr:prepilin-type N-terminal cleavage/methylation domain-containing protein [Actinoplanes sp. L3-i22]BCY05889.1 pili assembly chaperone [Actinoplanes sp. L3-i22]